LKEKSPGPQAEIGPETARTYGIGDGDDVVIETNRGSVRMKARVNERVAEGVVLVPHGWSGEANANLLTDTGCREPIMGYPEVKALLCSIRKA
jgi:anaerobic selenocysteine-containing dehydrogenase